MPESPLALEIKDLTLVFEDQKTTKVVLNNVNLQVKQGEFVAIVGPSGCGKSSLLNLIAGFMQPTSGQILVDGESVKGPSRNTGIVFQDYTLFPWLTVVDNVAYGMELEEIDFLMKWIRPFRFRQLHRSFREKASHYLQEMGLKEAENKKPHQLSGGMKQRVAIAQEIIRKPSILLMDEPFGALDPQTREVLQILILKIHEQERNTVFFVTHDLEEAVYVAERVIVLSQYKPNDNTQGATIVKDVCAPVFKSTEVKRTEGFGGLIQDIRMSGFAPDQRDIVKSFDRNYQNKADRQ